MQVRSEERRICAGDWVRLAGVGASVRGLGKVVEADYDPADHALRLARVEFARGAFWFWPGDLRRIAADEEVRLVEEALDAVHMPEPARDRLRAALIEPPRPRTARSLGLLDLLWSLLGSLPNERAVRGLARFFDEGGAPRAFVEARPTPLRPVAPPPTPRPAMVATTKCVETGPDAIVEERPSPRLGREIAPEPSASEEFDPIGSFDSLRSLRTNGDR